INDNNIDDLTSRLNGIMSSMDRKSTEEMFRVLLSGSDMDSLTESLGEFVANGDGLSLLEIDEDQDSEEENDESPNNGLMRASIGGDSEAGNNERRTRRDQDTRTGTPGRDRKRKFLDQFGSNLTDKAREGQIDRIIGREKELERVIQILNRRSKNNPVLLGEPGVGKTAIAEGLAVKINNGEVPAKLLTQEVYLLDMTAMVAGTQFRGQFESRMKGVVDDARRNGNIILVIDELHNIMGAGDAEGAMNAANVLKPALAKGEIRVLGSTTLDEYRRFIEKDSALERRFQKVIVEEPSEAETVEILKGVRDYYEVHHHIIISDEVIETAVTMSSRYITDRFLPDKAIDLLDEAGSSANLANLGLVQLSELNTRHQQEQAALEKLENQIAGSPDNLQLFEQQADLRSRLLRTEKEIETVTEASKPTVITTENIAKVVEMWTGIPVQRISESEKEKLLKLEDRLHQRIVGQQEAVSSLARAIRRNRAGFGKKRKPSSFIFVGPTGVGKTELVKAVAEAMFESEDAMVRLDMSEFMEPHTVSKLIGSPPGYV
ncbi:MAG: ATP-dependent Clp protease ATP-binding subunit, partial [Ruminococcaceae bacterium]|nr:ATP-dependent Clp protease ATP-binding subunit [Oscillospiraceae bacterium]